MKKLLAIALLLSSTLFFMSCEDEEEDDPSFDAPTVTNPTATDLQVGATGSATFSVTVDEAAEASWTATAQGVTLDATSGAIDGSGSYELPFTAGNTAGAGSVTLTVSYASGESANATAVFTVLAPDDAPISISDIPAAAEIAFGADLADVPYAVSGDDGIATFEASVNGGDAVDFSAVTGDDLAGNPTSISGTFTVDWATLISLGGQTGSNTITFTATDTNGSAASFTHVLTVGEQPVVEVFASDEGTGTTTWTSDNIYILRGFVFVNDGQTLTIEPGTIIKGQPGEGAGASALIVARGGTIDAQGNEDAPIIFTSTSDEISPLDITAGNFISPNLTPETNGLWGGLIILGKAPISAQNESDVDVTEVQIEGIPTSETRGLYGGNDEADNSGTLDYVSVRHGGSLIGAGNEINGISLGGVGSGTTMSNIEVVANADDGIEWFGGDVDMTNALVWNSFDDALDTDQDWIGTLTNFLVVTPRGGSAFELDGPEGTLNRANHTFDQGTVVAGADVDHLVDWDGGTNAVLTNIYWTGIADGYGFIADDPATTPSGDEDNDETFYPIESYQGSTADLSADWFTDLSQTRIDEVFVTGPGDNASVDDVTTIGIISAGDASNGADLSVFGWTWAAQAGELDGIQ